MRVFQEWAGLDFDLEYDYSCVYGRHLDSCLSGSVPVWQSASTDTPRYAQFVSRDSIRSGWVSTEALCPDVARLVKNLRRSPAREKATPCDRTVSAHRSGMMNPREGWNDAVKRQVCRQSETRGLGLTGRWCDIRFR